MASPLQVFSLRAPARQFSARRMQSTRWFSWRFSALRRPAFSACGVGVQHFGVALLVVRHGLAATLRDFRTHFLVPLRCVAPCAGKARLEWRVEVRLRLFPFVSLFIILSDFFFSHTFLSC